MSLVIDASVALAWVLADETTPEALAIRARVIKEGALAPQHWRLEVGNALTMAARRKRYEAASLVPDLEAMSLLPILLDERTADFAWSDTVALAQEYKLTVYDAAYLELTIRSGLPLATFDADLSKATKAAGAKLVTP